jgi:hypothetical protein
MKKLREYKIQGIHASVYLKIFNPHVYCLLLFSLTLQPSAGYGLLVHEVS